MSLQAAIVSDLQRSAPVSPPSPLKELRVNVTFRSYQPTPRPRPPPSRPRQRQSRVKGRFIPPDPDEIRLPFIPPSGFSVVMGVTQRILQRAVTVVSQITGIDNRKHAICRGDDFALCHPKSAKKRRKKCKPRRRWHVTPLTNPQILSSKCCAISGER